jgi:hypothetical protein
MQLDEAVAGGDRRGRLLIFPVGVGDVDLRLLRVATVGIARFELFEVLDGLGVGAVVERILGFGIELVGRPADGFILASGRSPQPAIREATKSAAITAKLRMMKTQRKESAGGCANAEHRACDYSANPQIALIVPGDCSGQRLDQVLARLLAQHSRSRLQGWIREGRVAVGGAPVVEPRHKLWAGETIEVAEAPMNAPNRLRPRIFPCRWCLRMTA